MSSSPELDDFELVNADDVAKQMIEDDPSILPQILDWLKPTDYAGPTSEYSRHLSSQAKGTGEWIRETSQFKQWHDSADHGSIWIKAIPGAGKSVVAASMIWSLREKESVPVLYFFFRQIIENNRSSRSLLRDWLAQLCPYSYALQYSLWQVIDTNKIPLEEVSTDQLWQYLLSALKNFPKAYCIVDALDEMSIDEDFLSRVNSLGVYRPAQVKVLLTSRPKQYLNQALRDPSVIHVSLEEELVKRDILVFVQQRLENIGHLNPETAKYLLETICQRSEGLFLYARLMLDQIADSIGNGLEDDASIRRMVAQLPVGLEDMYNRVLMDSRVSTQVSQEVQVLILELIVFAARPLRLVEIARAIESSSTSTPSVDSKTIVRAACGPLLEIVENEIVQILHHSFTEFLLNRERALKSASNMPQFPNLSADDAHKRLALLCLQTLQSKAFDEFPDEPLPNPDQRRRGRSDSLNDDWSPHGSSLDLMRGYFLKYPFAQYAIVDWPHHIRALSTEDLSIYHALDKFCDPTGRPFRAWLQSQSLSVTSRVHGIRVTPLHVAAGYGLTGYARYLIQNGADVNALDRRESTPMHWAALKDQDETAKILIEAGANPDIDRYDGLKPLHHAASLNHAKAAKILLEAGVSPKTPKARENPGNWCGNAPRTFGTTALKMARQKNVIAEMLPYINEKDQQKLVLAAAEQGNSAVLAMLLAIPGLELPPVNEFGEDPLLAAVGAASIDCVRLLLDKGADPSIRTRVIERRDWSSHGGIGDRGVLHRLAESHKQDSPDVVALLDLLLKAGADINAKDENDVTPFHVLLSGRRYHSPRSDLIEAFLAQGANPNLLDKNGQSLLHLACGGTDAQLTKLLLKHGADPSLALKSNGLTPMHYAVQCIYEAGQEHVKVLIAHQANLNAQDSEGRTALTLLGIQHHSYVLQYFKLILEAGANPNIRDDKGQTCLHHLRDRSYDKENKTEQIIHLVFNAGFDAEPLDREGNNILHHHAKGDDNVVLDLLLKQHNHLNIETRTRPMGKTALHMACQSRSSRAQIKTLLSHGADPFAMDHEGNSPLHEVAARFRGEPDQIEVVGYLIDRGLTGNERNYKQQTALHIPLQSRTSYEIQRRTLASVLKDYDQEINVDAQDCLGYSPLHYAAAASEHMTYDLLKLGAKPNVRAYNKRTPLHCAARARNSGALALILDFSKSHGLQVDIDAKDIAEQTALHDACRSGRQESVSILLQAGADVGLPRDGIDIKKLPILEQVNRRDPTNAYFQACTQAVIEDKIWLSRWHPGQATDLRFFDPFRPIILTDCGLHRPQDRDSRLEGTRSGDIALLLLNALGNLETQTAYLWKVLQVATREHDEAIIDALHGKMMEMQHSKELSMDQEAVERFFSSIAKAHTQRPAIVPTGPSIHVPDIIAELPTADIKKLKNQGFDFVEAEKDRKAGVVISSIAEKGLVESMRFLIDEAMKTHIDSQEKPALHAACSRSFWNLDMVKLLVEVAHIDVNDHLRTAAPINYDDPEDTEGKMIAGPTVLHILAKGGSYWHVQATLYLLSKGADVDALDEQGRSPLCIACGHGSPFSPQICEALLSAGANVNFGAADGATPLSFAKANLDVVEVLLKHGVNLSAGKKQPLISAIEAADLKALKLFLRYGADCNSEFLGHVNFRATDSTGMLNTPNTNYFPLVVALEGLGNGPSHLLARAIQMGQVLLQHGARLDQKLTKNETFILHYLFQMAAPPVLDILLEHGFDPNLRDQNGRTVFMAACESTRFVEGGHFAHKDKSYPDFDYTQAAIRLSKHPKYSSRIDFLASDNHGRNMLRNTLLNWDRIKEHFFHIPGVKDLVNKQDVNGQTILRDALVSYKYNIAMDLVENYDADVCLVDSKGETTMHHCLRNLSGAGSLELRREDLQKLTADGKQITSDETTEYKDSFVTPGRLIETYLQRGGDPNFRNKEGESPLLVYLQARGTSWTSMDGTDNGENIAQNFPLLQKWGVVFSVVNNRGRGALHIVAKRPNGNDIYSRREGDAQAYNRFLFKSLVDRGCDPLAEDNSGMTALDIAAAAGNDKILELFNRTSSS